MVYVCRIEIDEENGQSLDEIENAIYSQDLANDIVVLQIYED